MKNQDIWGGYVFYLFCPTGSSQYRRNGGYSFLEEDKYKGKSEFMKGFYTGGRKNN
eukprot:CAMPEP_0205815732 /NCGR_PEP_ID=MMETSP0205-20121125/21655_1 /ASSEMBLY_ACC=CAM_ASM_000278 /TAXON_ID=36767 /ORGANISM="Euplotes focardii, Strain TN1" /LENGTH=55 /DNA_ID=CAMNT_0053102643 /DNA_START=351 /DNA_END=515 /DNA_ORIENTATION=+